MTAAHTKAESEALKTLYSLCKYGARGNNGISVLLKMLASPSDDRFAWFSERVHSKARAMQSMSSVPSTPPLLGGLRGSASAGGSRPGVSASATKASGVQHSVL
eukprot:CAMPEP_0204017474 /NCGR_PEP_ID=MMETSP0360-20130528/27428_1 /ASSEMBLY_ACC=CAM_ASM_000342 /TAXON_ID=268821 /ORGANISM="Scrippsiella Hangoei, Strain SHTV-5" /LENGTH=103 /DNA_ID=CAMNT_0050960537 /DNA_START=339 /DNA_END=646 /DNA_ORIENTATION=-